MSEDNKCRSCGAERVWSVPAGRYICPSMALPFAPDDSMGMNSGPGPVAGVVIIAGPELAAWLEQKARLQAVAEMWAYALGQRESF